MTREIIFNTYTYPSWKSRFKHLICLLFQNKAEVWKRICDIPLVKIDSFKYYLVIWQCTDCDRYQLWILKERMIRE